MQHIQYSRGIRRKGAAFFTAIIPQQSGGGSNWCRGVRGMVYPGTAIHGIDRLVFWFRYSIRQQPDDVWCRTGSRGEQCCPS